MHFSSTFSYHLQLTHPSICPLYPPTHPLYPPFHLQEYQLVEGVELLPYRNYIYSSFISGGTAPTAASLQSEKRTRPRASVASDRSLGRATDKPNSLSGPGGEGKGEKGGDRSPGGVHVQGEGGAGNNELFFVLSMGHRIQFLVYDPFHKQVNVTRLLAKHGSYKAGTGNELTDSYTYETWVPQLARYATMQQNFSQFPSQVH